MCLVKGQVAMGGTQVTQITTTTINEATEISLGVQTGTLSIPAGSKIELTAPSGIEVLVPGACTRVFPTPQTTLTCSKSAQTISITIPTAVSSNSLITLRITNAIRNPSSTRTSSSFTLTVRNASNNIIGQQTSAIFITATEGTITSTELSTTSQEVNAVNSIIVKFTATNGIPVGGIIKVKFPLWNPNAPISLQKQYFTGSSECTNRQNLNTGLSCAFSNQILTVTDAVTTTALGANTVVEFEVSGFTNPISTALISGFTIVTQDGSTGVTDTPLKAGNIDITTSPTLQVTTATSLTQASVTVFSAASDSIKKIVQEINDIQLSFNTPVPLDQNCLVTFTVPTQFSISNPLQIQACQLFSSNCVTPITPTQLSVNQYQFNSCSEGYRSSTLQGIIIFKDLQLPENIKVTDTFSISISNADSGASIASISTAITFQANPGTLTSVMTPDNPVVQTTTPITFQLTPQHSVPITSKLVITFPTPYTLPTSCSIQEISTIIDNTASCSLIGGNIEIIGFLNTAFDPTGSTIIEFKLIEVTLPMTTAQRTGLKILVQSEDVGTNLYYTIDQFSGNDIVPLSPGTITLTITPESDSAFDITNYKFEITPEHQVVQDGFLIIEYPPEVNIPDSSFSQSQSKQFLNFPTTPTITIDTTKRQILIRNGFKSTSLAPLGTTFSFLMPSVQNPPTLEASSTFKAYSYSDNSEIIDSVTSGVTIQMATTAIMKISKLSIGSYVNAAQTTYAFTLAASIPIPSTSRIRITFPAEVSAPSSTDLSCGSNTTNYINSVSCQFYAGQTNVVDAILDLRVNPLPADQVFQVFINNVRNPNSTKPSSSFKVEVVDYLNNAVNVNSANIVAQTNTPSTMIKASISQSNNGARQIATYTIEIYPTSNIQVGGGIEVIYPSQVSIPGNLDVTVTSEYTKSIVTKTIDKSSRQVLIKNAFQLTFIATSTEKVTITLEGFQNPESNEQSNSFIVRTFDISGNFFYYIDQVNQGLTLNSNCDYPCESCVIGQSSNCTSCFSGSTLNKLQGSTCVSQCSIGKFFNSETGNCEVCDSNCLACSGTATTCTACGTNGFLYLHNGKCTNTCPSGYVANADLNQCLKCSSQCLTCEFNQNTCTTCNTQGSTPYFFRSNCYNTCPKDISVASGFQCLECDISCKTCQTSQNTCTSCYSHMKFDKINNECIEVCNEGTQIYQESTGNCLACHSQCSTCSGSIFTCTSCKDDLVLNTDNTCRESCNVENQSPIDGVCKQCQLPCASCRETTDHCTSCQNDYLLYNTTCVQYCPDKYEANLELMQCILVGLICPTGFAVNEAGDGCVPTQIECQEGYIVNRAQNACIPAPGSPIPFPFLILTFCLCLIVLGSYIKDKISTKVLSCLIALIGTQELLIMILIVVYSGALLKWVCFGISLLATALLVITNIYMYVQYKKVIPQDIVFQKWCKHYPKTARYLPLLSLFVNFKLIRFFFNGFFGIESCQASFENPMKNFFPFLIKSTYGYLIAYFWVIAADISVFIYLKEWGYQLMVLAIESVIITFIILILIYFEFRDRQNLFVNKDEQYMRIKPKSLNNDNVMGGFEGGNLMDESTLVRKFAAEEEYEINLRKKALLSILAQVDKNFFLGQQKGIDMGGKIEQVKSKFDNDKLKLRRAFSLERINEEESWCASSHDSHQKRILTQEEIDDDEREERLRRRYSFPLTPRTLAQVHVSDFGSMIKHIQEVKKEEQYDNVYAEVKRQPRNLDEKKKKKKTVSRRTQTYLRELLNDEGEEFNESDLEVILEDDAEINDDFAKGLIENVIDGLSDSQSIGGPKGRRKKGKQLGAKRKQEIPEFELKDIMGEFDIDDMGNFIIIKGPNSELLDKFGRRVNRRGYLIDRFGNIINTKGQIIFKVTELNENDEIPAPFGYEKHKKNLLNMSDTNDFQIKDDQQMENDEDLIDAELKKMRKKKGKKRRKQTHQSYKSGPQGQIDEENEDDEDEVDEESSIDSLMADTPGKYQQLKDDDEMIDRVTKKKIPKGRAEFLRGSNTKSNKKSKQGSIDRSQSRGGGSSMKGSSRRLPQKRIKQDDTKDLFPTLQIESSEQKKLQKIVESIGGFAGQLGVEGRRDSLGHDQRSYNNNTPGPTGHSQERFDKLRKDQFRDTQTNAASRGILSNMSVEYNRRVLPESGLAQINPISSKGGRKKGQRRPNHATTNPLARIYGNLHDVVQMEEKFYLEHQRTGSPHSSEFTSRLGRDHSQMTIGQGEDRKIRGLENIYLKRFEQQKRGRTSEGYRGYHQQSKRKLKPKFRETIDRFTDDPRTLLEEEQDYKTQQEMNNIIDQTERLQRQYINNASSNRFTSIQNQSMPLKGIFDNSKSDGRMSAQIHRNDPALGNVKKGTWMEQNQ